MNKIVKAAIHDLVLYLRKILEAEIERELGRYGIYADRNWIRVDELPRLNTQEKSYIRPRIEAAIQRELDAGVDTVQAVRAFIRETAYTHLNRLLGLKCMDARGLIKETITTREIYSGRSQRHRDYLDEHPEANRLPDRGLGLMLQEACAEVSQQIGVVFDPESDYSLLWPRHTVLKECIDAVNQLDVQVANRDGGAVDAIPSAYSDDTVLGWVYQYFQEEEKARVFAEVSQNKKKIGGQDIIPATTAYTERYMVQFLVENSLGALWMEMYPDSDLCQGWDYFVEDPNLVQEDGSRQHGRDPMPVSEITLLDPACGSGHFLLYAFDLFAQLYEAEASMQNKRIERIEIARSILRYNLYGIDIDLRSIQLSALNLFMKACTYACVRLDGLQNGGTVQMNVVCADIVLMRGTEFDELLKRFKGDPLTQSLIQTIWRGLENARELGSLLKIDEEIDDLIRRKRQVEKGTFWEHPEELWEQWKKDFLGTIKDLLVDNFDVNKRIFNQETIKSLNFLDLVTSNYDIVIANPPYLGHLNMSPLLRNYLNQYYKEGSGDLYSAFIQRNMSFCKLSGFVSMVCQQTFLFLSSFTNLREAILHNFCFRTLAHLGPGAFEDIGGEMVNTAIFVMRHIRNHEQQKGIFLRLTDEYDKKLHLIKLVKDHTSHRRYIRDSRTFKLIDTKPISYWMSQEFEKIINNSKRIGNLVSAKAGLATGDNDRFVTYWWEVEKTEISNEQKWYPCVSKGGSEKWYVAIEYSINWADNGDRIKNFFDNKGKKKSRPQNEKYYFKEGLTYAKLSSTGFGVRYLPPGVIFLDTNRFLAAKGINIYYVLGLCNSAFTEYSLRIISPSISFTSGEVENIPFTKPNPDDEKEVSQLAKICVDHKLNILAVHPQLREFKNISGEYFQKGNSLKEIYLVYLMKTEGEEIGLLLAQGAIDRKIFNIYGLGNSTIKGIFCEIGTPPAWQPIIKGHISELNDIPVPVQEFIEHVPKVSMAEWLNLYKQGSSPSYDPNQLLPSEIKRLYEVENNNIGEICSKLNINPLVYYYFRQKLQLVNHGKLIDFIENLLTHRIWELVKRDQDGILPYDEGLDAPSLLQQVRGEIETLFGVQRALGVESEINEILGKGGLATWLGDPFFKKHVSQFKYRPILWQITSPGKNFRILLYYHKIDHDTLPKVRSQYLWPLLERARTQLRVEKKRAPLDINAIAKLEEYIADLEECDQRLEIVIQGSVKVSLPEWSVGPYRDRKAPYNPDLNDGVRVNLLPLQAAGLLPMKKVVKE